MKIDRSKLSNKDDLLAILVTLATVLLFCVVIVLAEHVGNFAAGYTAAAITLKWKEWLYDPAEKILDKLWRNDDVG